MFNAICFISIIENCLCFDLYNIMAYVVTFDDYRFCPVIIVATFSLRAILLIALGLW